MKIDRINIGQLIREKVAEKGLTQAEFARKIGMARQNVTRLVFNKPSIDTELLCIISEVLGCNLFDYFKSNMSDNKTELKATITIEHGKERKDRTFRFVFGDNNIKKEEGANIVQQIDVTQNINLIKIKDYKERALGLLREFEDIYNNQTTNIHNVHLNYFVDIEEWAREFKHLVYLFDPNLPLNKEMESSDIFKIHNTWVSDTSALEAERLIKLVKFFINYLEKLEKK